ncbi:hypothetical protein [Aeromonas sp. 603607]|uniref:hypothetical protein n=1 Tax=Aeromonas sp. 603607 TaxID=2712048 RepID=UPI003B9F746C
MKIEIELPPGYTCKTITSGETLKIQIVQDKTNEKKGSDLNKIGMRILKRKGFSKKNKAIASSSKGTTSTGPKKTYVKS